MALMAFALSGRYGIRGFFSPRALPEADGSMAFQAVLPIE
jgi:hypothetical protein